MEYKIKWGCDIINLLMGDPLTKNGRCPYFFKGEQAVWQRRFWEHQIRDEKDFARHVEYIHYNPVKHGLVKSPHDWAYSSFHCYVKQGIYKSDWGAGCEIQFDEDVGYE